MSSFLLGFFYYVDTTFKAIPPLETARRLNPNDARAPFYLALCYDGLGRGRRPSPSTNPPLLWSERAAIPHPMFMSRLRGCSSHSAVLRRAKRTSTLPSLSIPNRATHTTSADVLLFERDEFASAAEEGEKALAVPGAGTLDRQIHFLLARAYSKLGRKELASMHLAKFKDSAVSLRR